jgi:hypothetical protein
MLISLSFHFASLLLTFPSSARWLYTHHTRTISGTHPSFWTWQENESRWAKLLSNEADAYDQRLGGFTLENDPTALDKPFLFLFTFGSISFVVGITPLLFFCFLFTNFKDTLFVVFSCSV